MAPLLPPIGLLLLRLVAGSDEDIPETAIGPVVGVGVERAAVADKARIVISLEKNSA